jgi:hypothetical protein
MEELDIQSKAHRSWILIAQAGWWIFAGLSILLFLAAFPEYFRLVNQVCAKSPCLGMQLNTGRAIILQLVGLDFEFYARLIVAIQTLVFLINLSIGVFIFSRKSRDWLAILVSLMLITSIQTDLYQAILIAYPALRLPAAWLGIVNSVLIVVFFYIFPTGSFRPRWTAGLAGLWIILLAANSANPVLALTAPSQSSPVFFLFLFALIGSSLFVLVYRYRNIFNSAQRDQSKWVVFGVVVAWGGQVILEFLRLSLPAFRMDAIMFISLNILILVWSLIMPVSIMLAVLSSALMDIDVLIRRTLAYSALTVTLLVVYISSVLLLQKIFVFVTGQRSSIVSIVSTLVIAAMFTPLRLRIQMSIDRVFFRNAYNTEHTIQAFHDSVREDVNREVICTQLVGIVRSTLQPEFISLWMCKIVADKDTHSPDQIR